MSPVFLVPVGFLLVTGIVFTLFFRRLNDHSRYVNRKSPADFDIPFEEVRIPVEGQSLYGWWICDDNKPSDKTLILVHGWGRNVERTLHMIEHFYPLGYQILSIDLRDHGRSDRVKYATYGVFTEDVKAAVDFVARRGPANQEIIVFGLSIGGSVAYPAAADEARIAKIISVGSPANPAIYIRDLFEKKHIPWFLVGWIIVGFLKYRARVDLARIAAIHTVNRSQARCLVIHGDADTKIPVKHGRLFAATGDPERVTYWELPGYGHSNCNEHPEFWNRVDEFIAG